MNRLVILVILTTTLVVGGDGTCVGQTNDSTQVDSAFLARQEKQVRFAVFMALIPVLVAFSFIVFVFYRARRESFLRQQETEFRLSLAQLELKALRAQISPHFIFNCLNSIHHYMHEHGAKPAGDFLIKFSQLIRYILESSSSQMIPLAEDLEALRIYLELERLRLHRTFGFHISVELSDNPHEIHIPPMMIQPFVENAIWHGIANTGDEGRIDITLTRKGDILRCVVEDNGRRREASGAGLQHTHVKKTSMGMSLIQDRLTAINRLYNSDATFSMHDRCDDPVPACGTRIELTLPVEY